MTEPETAEDLDGTHLLDLDLPPPEMGDELWLPVSPIRGDGKRFRAIKVEVKDLASVGNYEGHHALHNKEEWEKYDKG